MVPLALLGIPLVVRIDTTLTGNVSLGDLDGDGDLDVIVARGEHWSLVNLVLLNDGDGLFERHSLDAIADPSYSAVLADVQGDGHLDVVVGNDAVAKGIDVDGNGWQDIVTGDEDRGGISVYLNRGNASFEDALAVAPEHNFVGAIAVADMDGDGDSDIVIGALTTEAILVNDGTGRAFTIVPLRGDEGSQEVNGVAIGDVDGNGIPDVVTARSGVASMVYLDPLAAQGQPSDRVGPRRYPLFSTGQ